LGYVLVHRVAPVGTDPAVFIGTGVLPYILCIYPARETMMCLVANGPLLTFPIVKVSDIIIARGLLQSIVAFWVALLFSLIMYLFDVDVYPRRPEEAALATVVSIYFGFSIGFIAAVLYKVFRPWLAIQVGLLILMYFTAGIVILPTSVPQPLRDYLWFNPMLHQVEWLRSAYYDDFGQGMLSKEYLIGFATVVLLLGLSAERALRGKLQQPS
jgi:capsular polysaccharide transport system permease protein